MVKDEANITIGAFYRQPSRDITEIDDLMTTLLSIHNGNRATAFIVGGDFNLPGIIWVDNVTIKDTLATDRRLMRDSSSSVTPWGSLK